MSNSNDTSKEERTYEPFLGAKKKFVKDLEKKKEEQEEENESLT